MATITVKQGGGGDFDDINDALQNVGLSPGAGAGDIVEVYDGIYTEGIINNLPSGTSWSSPFIIRAAPAQTPTIKNSGERNITVYDPVSLAFFSSIEGFIFDGTNLTSHQVALSASDSSPSSIRLYNNEFIYTEYIDTIFIGSFANDIRIVGNRIHSGAFVGEFDFLAGHGVYLSGSNCIIEDNQLYDIGGFGVHEYNNTPGVPQPSNNIIRRNIVHDVGFRRHTVSGILVTGSGTKSYKNVVYNVFGADGDGGVGISIGSSNNHVYNNTIFNCSWIGILAGGASSGAVVRNNITYNNGLDVDFTNITGNGTPSSFTQSNNLTGINPLFVDSTHGDFHLQANSPAIDYGTVLDLSYVGTAPDAGAFEYGGQNDEEPPINTGGTEPPPVETPPTPTAPILPVIRDWVDTDGSIKDQYNQGLIVAERDSSNQYVYTLNIPAGALAIGDKIRLKATVHIATTTPPNCDPCVAWTNPGEQELDAYTYDYRYGIPIGTLGGNVSGQVNYIASLGDKEEFIATIGNRSGFYTSYDHINTIGVRINNGSNWQVLRFVGERGERVEPVGLPFGYEASFNTLDAHAGHSGHSDEFGYLMGFPISAPPGLPSNMAYFSYDSDEVTFLISPPSFVSSPNSWTKYEDELYGLNNNPGITKWTISSNFLGVDYTAGGKTYIEVFATATYLWGLTSSEIVQLRKDTLEVITTYDISPITGSGESFFIIEDRAAYIRSNGGELYYISFDDPDTIQFIFDTGFSGDLMHYRQGYFYFVPHNFGFGSGLTQVVRVGPLVCPGTEVALGD